MNPSVLEPPFPLLHPKRKLSAGEKVVGIVLVTVFLAGAVSSLAIAILFTIVAFVLLVVATVYQVRYSVALRQVRHRMRVDERPRPALTTGSRSRLAQARPAPPTPALKQHRQPPALPRPLGQHRPSPAAKQPTPSAPTPKVDPVALGRQARLGGASIVTDPYPPGTLESDAWLRGWAGFRS